MIPESKRKFLRYGISYQHRRCAQLLRIIYEELLKGAPLVFDDYETLVEWMKLSPYQHINHKTLADRYHLHLQLSGHSLKEHNLLPVMRRGDHAPKAPFGDVAIYLDRIRSAYNVGSILRTTEALRIGTVHCSGLTPFVTNEKVQRTALGSAELVPAKHDTPLDELPRPFIALETCEGAIPVSEFIFPTSFTLILGNEEYGVSDLLLQQADALIEIPLVGVKNSLNVACAYAIAAAEIKRQLSCLPAHIC